MSWQACKHALCSYESVELSKYWLQQTSCVSLEEVVALLTEFLLLCLLA